jgi:hypothetical protein
MTLAIPAPAVATSAPAASVTPRISPALVNGQRVWLECPSWCTEDHVAANERHLEDVCHGSRAADLIVPRQDGSARLMLLTRLIAGDYGSDEDREPLVTVDVDDVQGMYLSPKEADDFADGLVAFAEEIRALARTARGL